MLTHFDHLTIAVNDLDAAAASYETLLGTPPVWRGEHAELGTRAALFGLGNALIELVGPRPGAEEAEGLRALLSERGQGLSAIAFGVDDAAATSVQLRERGVRVTPPQDGEAKGHDGSTRHYRVLELSPRITRGVSVLAVERPDLRALCDAAAPLAGDFGALDHVVLRTSAPQAALDLYGQALGLRLALDRELFGTRMLFFRIGGVTLEVVADSSLGDNDTLWGLAYRVQDIDAAYVRLSSAGVGVSPIRDGRKPGTRVFSVKDGTCSVPTLVIRDPSRDR